MPEGAFFRFGRRALLAAPATKRIQNLHSEQRFLKCVYIPTLKSKKYFNFQNQK